jgi:hypothetical protein
LADGVIVTVDPDAAGLHLLAELQGFPNISGQDSYHTHGEQVSFSVADPGCLSRIPDLEFYPYRIPDPKTATKESGEKKFDVKPFFVATNFTKLKKLCASFQRIIELFTQKFVTKL